MNTYKIPESNIDTFEKKVNSIQKKCEKYGYSFICNQVGEEFREGEDDKGKKFAYKVFVYEVEGEIRHEGWRFVATIDHHEAGNVIRAIDHELIIPDRYKTCGPTCEHCNKIRSRKDTYLVYNESAREFKQLGKSCMQEYTNGIDAEFVAYMSQFLREVEEGQYSEFSSSSIKRYMPTEEVLRYAFECYHHFGYEKSFEYDEYGNEYARRHTTRERVCSYMYGPYTKLDREEMEAVGFNASSEYAVENTAKALEWIKGVTPDNEYLRNLKIIASEEYVENRSFGILVSLTTAYMRNLEYTKKQEEKQIQKEREEAAGLVSEYQGNVKDRIAVNCTSFTCVTTTYSEWGASYLYKFIDENNNVYIWWASKDISEPERVITVVGTVKDHQEYNGTKQTVMTRCKVTLASKQEAQQAQGTSDVQEALDKFFEVVNA